MSKLVLETLLKKREQIQAERVAFLQKTGTEIREIDEAVAQLNNGEYIISQRTLDAIYDDENPDYVKASQEEI